MFKVKLGRPMVKPILRMVAIVGGRLNKSLVGIVYGFCADVHSLVRKGGIRFAVIYLKAASTVLQQSVGGQRLQDMTPLGVRFARTKSGLPKLIPTLHRAKIRSGDHKIIRLWMTLFSVYRVMEFKAFAKISSIVDPGTMPLSMVPLFSSFIFSWFIPAIYGLIGKKAYALFPGDKAGIGDLKAKPFIIRKSSPAVEKVDPFEKMDYSLVSTSPIGIALAAQAWKESPLYPTLRSWCEATKSIWILNAIDRWSKGLDRDDVVDIGGNLQTGSLGKLGLKAEPAGKVRVFAMVDPFTQWLMKPLHDRIFSVLSRIPQDGTFNQSRPLEALLSRAPGSLYSYDLSAATDRLPLVLQKVVLSKLLGAWGAECWGNLLVGRPYWLYQSSLNPGRASQQLTYSVGQPMGALSSWAMLALTHHAIVQWSAVRSGFCPASKPIWFTDYALLGDDIVIGNARVAKEYKLLMETLGVSIGDHKSLISTRGVSAEFAKKFFVKSKDGKFVDCSPLSLLETDVSIRSVAAGLELIKSWNLTLAQYLTMLGYGYRVKGRADAPLLSLSKRVRHYVLAFLYLSVNSGETFKQYVASKSLYTKWEIPSAGELKFLPSFFLRERDKVLELIERFPKSEIMKLVQVKRDREYYGTATHARYDNEPTFHINLKNWPEGRFVIDQIVEYVYRDPLLDAVIAVRDATNRIEELESSDEITIWFEQFDLMYRELTDLVNMLSSLPLPQGLSARVAPKELANSKRIFEQWYFYSKILRSTKT